MESEFSHAACEVLFPCLVEQSSLYMSEKEGETVKTII